MKEIRILPAVLHDIAEAAAWYDEEGYAGLGETCCAKDGEVARSPGKI